MNVGVTTQNKNCVVKAKRLAIRLNLPFVEIGNCDYSALLIVNEKRLELCLTEKKSLGPIYVDFLSGKLAHRCKFGGGKGQLIAKAVGIQTKRQLHILDSTAGLGCDAFILANLGCKITMLERNPIIAALLKDGLTRAREKQWFQELKLKLIENEAEHYLKKIKTFPDIIYIDPMYPPRKKSALVKKEMRILRHIVGGDENASKLLSLALKKSKKRVVVKRAKLDPEIKGPKPDLVFKGKSSRFDVYLAKLKFNCQS